MFHRTRLIYVSISIVTVVAGLTMRRFGRSLPHFIGAYAPDTLWAMLVFWICRMFAPGWSGTRAGVTTLVFSFGIELSQLYHAPWIDSIRNTTLGGLVLGSGFLWSDLACYTAGVLVAAAVDILIRRVFHPSRQSGG